MNKRLVEDIKVMTSAISQAFTGATTTVNGRGVPFTNEARKVMFRYVLGNIASTDTDYTLSVLEATDAGTTGARNVGDATSTPTITLARVDDGCIANASVVELTMDGVAADDEVTINGVKFTGKGDTDLDENEFDRSGTDTETAAQLVLCINNALPDLIASNSGDEVTVQSRVPGQETITVTDINDIDNIVPVTVEVAGIIEVDASALSDGFTHVFPRAVTSGTSAAATLEITAITGNHRYNVGQQTGGEAFAPNN